MPITLDGNGIIKNINFQHPSASATNLSLNSDGTIGGAIPYPNRNLIYNGAMQVAQRGTSTASITTNGYYTADRWQAVLSSLGTWTQTLENDAPTGTGFRKSLKMLCTTADASPAAADYVFVVQYLEGQDLQRIAKGTSAAQQLTMSFWVKSNVTGTYIVELIDNDNARSVSASYTISASATWERKTVTFPADTTGAFDNDNGLSFGAQFWLGAGSNFTGGSPLQTTWGTTINTRATGQTNLAAATNNYWQVTGVQLETGPVATPFEFEPYETTLRKCQRYYQRWTGPVWAQYGVGAAQTTTNICVTLNHTVTMRAAPSAVERSNVQVSDFVTSPTISAVAIDPTNTGTDVTLLNVTVTGATQYRPYFLQNANNAAGYVALSAEF